MLFVIITALLAVPFASADTSLGCFSSVQSASSSTNQFQTPSLCVSTCSKYAYVGLFNGGGCFCLTQMPTTGKVDNSQCNVDCYGYGTTTCGGAQAYQVYLGTGTIGASNSGASSQTGPSKTSSATESSSSSTTSSATSQSASPTNLGDSSASSSYSQQQSVVYSTVTASTSTTSKTSEALNTSSSSSSPSPSSSASSKKSSNTGAIVGGVVGGIAAFAIIGALVFFFLRYRNREDEEDDEGFNYETKSGLGLPSRGPSKRVNPLDLPMSNPFTHPSDDHVQGPTRTPGLVDPRLNPVMMGRRRLSEGSLADEADYSRKILQVANPDRESRHF